MQHHQEIYNQPDEIDLFELFENLVKEKATILGITIFGGILATLAAFLQPNIYSGEAVLNVAPMSNFAKFNAIDPLIGFNYFDNKQVYQKYYKKLTSFDTIEYAFHKTETAQTISNEQLQSSNPALLFALDEFKDKYSTSSEIIPSGREGSTLGRTTIRITSSNPEEPEYLINKVVLPYTQNYINEQLKLELQEKINQETIRIINQIKDAEYSFLVNTRHSIIELEESLHLANSANITEPFITDSNSAILGGAQFLLGTPLLSAQLETMNKREEQYRYYSTPKPNDENKPYIRGVAEKVNRLEQLMQIDTNFSELQPVTIERKAEIAYSPDKPNKKLIIVLGIILGGMLGIFAAMIKISIRSRKERLLALTNH